MNFQTEFEKNCDTITTKLEAARKALLAEQESGAVNYGTYEKFSALRSLYEAAVAYNDLRAGAAHSILSNSNDRLREEAMAARQRYSDLYARNVADGNL